MEIKKYTKGLKNNIDSITTFTLELWFRVIKKYRIKKETKVLRWVAFDSNFKSAEYDKGFKQWVDKGVTAWCTLEKDGALESFQNMKDIYSLDKREFYRYLQLRDYYKKEIEIDPSTEVNGVIQIIMNTYKGKKIRIISALYKTLTTTKHSTKYIKEKWESEFNTKISDDDWQDMWKTHQTTTNSRIWREFSWKNLVRFFITPKVKSKYNNTNLTCWRECGVKDAADHSHIFWKCHKVFKFWGIVHETVQKILGYNIPMSYMILYLCNFNSAEESIRVRDKYLVKILLIASKKAITRKWGKVEPPCKEEWIGIVEEIYVMERLTHRLRLQQAQLEEKWEKWIIFRTKTSDVEYRRGKTSCPHAVQNPPKMS